MKSYILSKKLYIVVIILLIIIAFTDPSLFGLLIIVIPGIILVTLYLQINTIKVKGDIVHASNSKSLYNETLTLLPLNSYATNLQSFKSAKKLSRYQLHVKFSLDSIEKIEECNPAEKSAIETTYRSKQFQNPIPFLLATNASKTVRIDFKPGRALFDADNSEKPPLKYLFVTVPNVEDAIQELWPKK